VSELRGRLRSVFGDENQQPTIISSQMSSSSQPPEMPDQIGAFKLRGLLGKGGMGYVYEAYDPHLDRTVALKTVRLDVLGEAGKDRFLREARACSRISHPNVVTVYSAGEVDGDPFMAMELIRGRTLTRCLREDNVEWQELVSWVIQILGALELLHAEGIVHRDLKPENIMLTESGVPKLMDFGLAHMATAAQIPATGVMLGTVHYMSPEQVLGTESDARSDVVSMGVLLHRELSGNFPFEASHPMSVMYAIRNAPTPDIDVRAAGIPVELAQVITRALEKNPDDRYASAGPFRDALMELVSEEEVAATTKSSRTPWVIAAATILLATLGILWSINRGGDEPDRDAAIALNELGQSLVAGGEVAQARAEFRRALVADESYAVAWNNLGMLAFGEGELAEADSFLARASELDEHYAIARFNHGRVLEDRANPEAAIQSYAAAVTADSSFAAGYNNLAAVLLDLERSSEARDVVMTGLTKTLREDPARPFLHRTAGRVYWQLDEADSAIEQWELALVDLADDTTLLELLGEALLQARSLEAARPHWERLLELGDDAQKARAAQVLGND
jgi:serine/threonine protein kinase